MFASFKKLTLPNITPALMSEWKLVASVRSFLKGFIWTLLLSKKIFLMQIFEWIYMYIETIFLHGLRSLLIFWWPNNTINNKLFPSFPANDKTWKFYHKKLFYTKITSLFFLLIFKVKKTFFFRLNIFVQTNFFDQKISFLDPIWTKNWFFGPKIFFIPPAF